MRRGLIALLLAVSTPAFAEHLDREFGRLSARRVIDTLDQAAGDLQVGLRAATLDLLDVRFDVRQRHALLRLGGEIGDSFALRLDGKVVWRDGGARIATRLELGVAGERMSLRIPDFYLAPCNVNGQSGVEVRVPVLEGKF